MPSYIGIARSLALICRQPPHARGNASALSARATGLSRSSGEELFNNVCRGCHMADGTGASGAGTYPSLAKNQNLQSSGYPIS